MNRTKVKIISSPRLAPKLVVGQEYNVVVRQGKEFILDGYGGWVPLSQVKELDVIVEDA